MQPPKGVTLHCCVVVFEETLSSEGSMVQHDGNVCEWDKQVTTDRNTTRSDYAVSSQECKNKTKKKKRPHLLL